MYTLKVTNSAGTAIQLVPSTNYAVTSIDGLTPPAAVVNSSYVGGADGALFNSAKLDVRNIVLTVVPYAPIERNRLQLYRIFRPKDLVTLALTNGSRDVTIQGYVESVSGDLFTMRQALQISILCMYPYWQSAQEIVDILSNTLDMWEFPFETEPVGKVVSELSDINTLTITNDGDADTGIIIELVASGAVVNPVVIDSETLQSFELSFTMQASDVITINTRYAEKSVTLLRGGVTSNIINSLTGSPTWFQVPSLGSMVLTITADSGFEYLTTRVRHNMLYMGV